VRPVSLLLSETVLPARTAVVAVLLVHVTAAVVAAAPNVVSQRADRITRGRQRSFCDVTGGDRRVAVRHVAGRRRDAPEERRDVGVERATGVAGGFGSGFSLAKWQSPLFC
jgi:hypothetical protein